MHRLYGVKCENKANSANVKLGLGPSLAINEVLVSTAFVCQATHALHYDQLFPNLSISGPSKAVAAHQSNGCFWPLYRVCCQAFSQ
jgi:hypothetical protein